MIIKALLDMLYSILSKLMVLNIPDLPEQAEQFISDMFDYLVTGAGILANYSPLGYLLVLFGVLLAVDAGIMIYHFIMWIIRKIPMAGIS